MRWLWLALVLLTVGCSAQVINTNATIHGGAYNSNWTSGNCVQADSIFGFVTTTSAPCPTSSGSGITCASGDTCASPYLPVFVTPTTVQDSSVSDNGTQVADTTEPFYLSYPAVASGVNNLNISFSRTGTPTGGYGANAAVFVENHTTSNAGAAGTIAGISNFTLQTMANGGTANAIIGVQSEAWPGGAISGTATVSKVAAFSGQATNEMTSLGGTVTQAMVLDVVPSGSAVSDPVTNEYGVYIEPQTGESICGGPLCVGTLMGMYVGDQGLGNNTSASFYGVYIDAQTSYSGHATNYGLYVNNAPVFLGNNVTNSGTRTGTSSNTDAAGQLTFSASTTSNSYTFTGTYATAPICTITPLADPVGRLWISTLNTTTLTLTDSSSVSITVDYECRGRT